VKPNQRGHYDSICVTDTGTVVAHDSLCSDVSTPIPGLHHPVEASADGLLYVNNGFGEEIWVLDAADYHLITALGDPDPTYLAVEPAQAVVKPVVTAVAPNSGSPAGGDPVIVTGANFQAGAVVHFGTEPATGVVVESSYLIRAVTPASSPPGTTGAVEVKVENPDGRTGILQQGFTYQLDTTAPVFTIPPYVNRQVLVGDPGSETATVEVRWQTDEASTSVVDYRELGAPAFLQAADPALVTDHLVVLTGLATATDHELLATSADAHGNAASAPATTVLFTTPTAPDVTAPVITSGPTVSAGTDSALVQWTTHEPATST
ncbi:MAG: hypothetical protein GY715_19140, partial [Planctomycetes bacterium]|nr:hypothetical protein [Planctomycetota bacterium]